MISSVDHYQILSDMGEQFCLTAEASFAIKQNSLSGNNSVVECDLAKVEVAGSNPVSRSKKNIEKSQVIRSGSFFCLAAQ
jgi:hypothetical protein